LVGVRRKNGRGGCGAVAGHALVQRTVNPL
jgi:hypothetical protein